MIAGTAGGIGDKNRRLMKILAGIAAFLAAFTIFYVAFFGGPK